MALRNLRNNQGSLFHPFSEHSLFSPWFGGTNTYQDLAPKVDIYIKDKEISVLAELPGFKKEDISIDFSDNLRQLTISGTKKRNEAYSEGDITHNERSFGSFSRSFTLPHGVKSDEVKAKYDNGVLEVNIPRDEASVQRKIEIS